MENVQAHLSALFDAPVVILGSGSNNGTVSDTFQNFVSARGVPFGVIELDRLLVSVCFAVTKNSIDLKK